MLKSFSYLVSISAVIVLFASPLESAEQSGCTLVISRLIQHPKDSAKTYMSEGVSFFLTPDGTERTCTDSNKVEGVAERTVQFIYSRVSEGLKVKVELIQDGPIERRVIRPAFLRHPIRYLALRLFPGSKWASQYLSYEERNLVSEDQRRLTVCDETVPLDKLDLWRKFYGVNPGMRDLQEPEGNLAGFYLGISLEK